MKTIKPNNNKMYLTNNDRKMHGLPLHRKMNKQKRFKTRCEPMETLDAFLNYVHGVYDD